MIRVFYHQVKPGIDCPDGIAAAWIVFNALKEDHDIKIVGVCYQSEIPEVEPGDRVFIVDFSFPADIQDIWAYFSESILEAALHPTTITQSEPIEVPQTELI